MLKYLRIAVTALCLTACVLLVALWVQAKWEFSSDVQTWSYGDRSAGQRRYRIQSWNGMFIVDAIAFDARGVRRPDRDAFPGFGFRKNGGTLCVKVQYWFVALWPAVFAAVLWFPWSSCFSLRTLLIATTLVAVGMGVIVAVT